jgi:hypothetical protein
VGGCCVNEGTGVSCINGGTGAGGCINESTSTCVVDACVGCMNGGAGMCGANVCMASIGMGCVNRGMGAGCTKGDTKVWCYDVPLQTCRLADCLLSFYCTKSPQI